MTLVTKMRYARIFAFAVCIPTLLAALAATNPSRLLHAAAQGAAQPTEVLHAEIDHLSDQTAQKIVEVDPQKILIAPLSGCLASPKTCEELDTDLRANLQKAVPQLLYISREEGLKHLPEYHFLQIDAYMGALSVAGASAGAEVVVSEDIQWPSRNKCVVHTNIVESKYRYLTAEFSTEVACSTLKVNEPAILTDPDTGISLIVTGRALDSLSHDSLIRQPTCLHCPNPKYTAYARSRHIQGIVKLLMTISEQGRPRDLRVVGGPEDSLIHASVEVVKAWQFRPATDAGGKPIACRVPVEVTFRLLN